MYGRYGKSLQGAPRRGDFRLRAPHGATALATGGSWAHRGLWGIGTLLVIYSSSPPADWSKNQSSSGLAGSSCGPTALP